MRACRCVASSCERGVDELGVGCKLELLLELAHCLALSEEARASVASREECISQLKALRSAMASQLGCLCGYVRSACMLASTRERARAPPQPGTLGKRAADGKAHHGCHCCPCGSPRLSRYEQLLEKRAAATERLALSKALKEESGKGKEKERSKASAEIAALAEREAVSFRASLSQLNPEPFSSHRWVVTS